jgi:hypothetical protein
VTNLQSRALARLPLDEATVERLYASYRMGPNNVGVPGVVLAHMRDVLESHERLRAELLGAETLIAETTAAVAAVMAQLDELVAEWGNTDPWYVGVRRCRDRLRKLVPGEAE